MRTGDDEHDRDPGTTRPTNVVRLPRDWLGPRTDLVPLHLPSDEDGSAAVFEFPGPAGPSHDDFWSGAPDAIPDPVIAPADDPGAFGGSTRPPPDDHSDGPVAVMSADDGDTSRGIERVAWRPRIALMVVLSLLVVGIASRIGRGTGRPAMRATKALAGAAITFPPSLPPSAMTAVADAPVAPHRVASADRRQVQRVRHSPRQRKSHTRPPAAPMTTLVAAHTSPTARSPSGSASHHATPVFSTRSGSSPAPASSIYSSGTSTASSAAAARYRPITSGSATYTTTSSSHKSGPVGAGAPFGPGVQIG